MASKKINFQRWRDIVAYAIFSYVLLNLISDNKKIATQWQHWSNLLGDLPLWQTPFLVGLGLIICYKLLVALKIFNINHHSSIKEQFKYPPLYFSVFISILIFVVDGGYHLGGSSKLSVLILLYLIACIVLYFHNKTLNTKDPAPQEPIEIKEIDLPKWLVDSKNYQLNNFYLWLNKEQPIENNLNDDFNREIYIERIINKIKDNSKAHHIAIVGNFGAGKSSIVKIIHEHFKAKSNEVIFTFIDGWGITEKSCSTYILEELINSLAEHVDCFSIRKIPQEYLGALSNSNTSNSKSITSLLSIHNYKPPLQVLEKINRILLTINKKMVVVLEDFDRTTKANEVINELASLLDRLREFENISFIINIGNKASFDSLSRIVTYREDLSDISGVKYLSYFFDLATVYENQKNGFSLNSDKSIIHGTAEELTALIKTPRDLKNVLRRVFDSWIYLAGEIDLYDLIYINAIRYVEPSAFNLIAKNINRLQIKKMEKNSDLIKEIEDSCSEESKESIKNITSILFESDNFSDLRNQKLAYNGETNYFKRALEERVDNKSDIEALKFFISLSKKTPTSLTEKSEIIDKICESKFLQEKIFQFSAAQFEDRPIFNPIHFYWIYSHFLKKEINLSDKVKEFFDDFFKENHTNEHWVEIISLAIKHDFKMAKKIVNGFINNQHVLNIFVQIFLKEINTPEKFISLIPGITVNDLKILLRPTTNLGKLIDLLVSSFSLNPNKVSPYIADTLVRFVSFDATEYNLEFPEPWRPHTPVLKDTFNKMDSNSIDYPHEIEGLINAYKSYFNRR